MPVTPYGNIPSSVYPYLPIIEKYSRKYDVPVMVIARTILVESAGDPKAWNPQNNENSRGLMQISEKTATTDPAINLTMLELNSLYDPETNIKFGTKYLAKIRDYLKPYFQADTDPKTKWLVITSSYNQGMGYYKRALQLLSAKGENHDWPNIMTQVLNLSPRPWPENVQYYGPKVVGPIDMPELFIDKPMFSPISETYSFYRDIASEPKAELFLSKRGITAISVTIVAVALGYYGYKFYRWTSK